MAPRLLLFLALSLCSVWATLDADVSKPSEIKRRHLQGQEDEDIEYFSRFIDGTADSFPPAPTPSRPTPARPIPSRPTPSPPRPSPPTPLPPTSGLTCESKASVTCMDENGVSCDEIVPPQGECETGASLDTVIFQVELCSCDESRNTQADFLFSCTDVAPLPSNERVRITCLTADINTLLFSGVVEEGDFIALSHPVGRTLPDRARCNIFSQAGSLLQSLTIRMSEQDDLYLKDKFGSLTMEACNTQKCTKDIFYTYTVENTGDTPMTVTKFERVRNGNREALNPNQIPFELAPGDSKMSEEAETVDLCEGAEYFTIVEAVAVPPDGDECPSEADFFFPVLDGCLVDVQVTCKTEEGVECSGLESPSGGEDCFVEVSYEYELSNVGTGVMDITVLERTRNEDTVSLLDQLSVTSLDPGESTNVMEKETINACAEVEYCTDVVAEADPPSDQRCFDEEMYKFSTTPTCQVSVDMSCATVSGLGCQNIQAEELVQCNCIDSCARALVYRYTAASCEAGLDGCANSGTNALAADIVIANGDRVLFEGTVQIDDDVIVRSNDCLPDTLQVLVSPAGDQPPSQVVLIDSSCAGEGPSLLDNIGAFEFVSYTCSDGNSHSCFVEVEYSVTTSNIGTTTQTVTDWTFDLNGELRGPGIELPTLELDESFTKFESGEVSLCTSGEYSATATVVSASNSGNDKECEDSQTLEFSISAPDAPALPLPPPTTKPPTLPPPASLSPPNEEECVFEMDIECVPPAGTASCNATPPPAEQCEGRPFEMGFLYNGGGCSGSWNVQEAEGKFFCNDFNGGPPTERGEKSFIVVTDLKGETIFHSDYVLVGSIYTLYDGGEDFPADQLITIYQQNSTDDPSSVLQSIQYHSSCSSNLFLKDRFGASQLVLWVNEDQGVISCFANQTFNLDIAIPIDIEGGPATVTGLTISSNVEPFFFNLTEKVAGIQADAGNIIQTTIAIPIDLTEKKTYSLLMTLTAVTAAGQSCIATELMRFDAGYPLPPIFPTFSPTGSPT